MAENYDLSMNNGILIKKMQDDIESLKKTGIKIAQSQKVSALSSKKASIDHSQEAENNQESIGIGNDSGMTEAL